MALYPCHSITTALGGGHRAKFYILRTLMRLSPGMMMDRVPRDGANQWDRIIPAVETCGPGWVGISNANLDPTMMSTAARA